MGDIIIRVVDMPPSVKATVSTSPDGCYNVYINAKLNRIQQQIAADHEMRHIRQGHLFRESDVTVDEAEAERRPASPRPESSPAHIPPQYASLRTRLGYSAYQVSRMTGISTGRYLRIERGLSMPTPEEQQRLTAFYQPHTADK